MLTAEQIDAAMKRARQAVCTMAMNCTALPDPPELAQQSATEDGWQKIGWIVSETGRYAWDVWYHAERDEGRARARPWGGE